MRVIFVSDSCKAHRIERRRCNRGEPKGETFASNHFLVLYIHNLPYFMESQSSRGHKEPLEVIFPTLPVQAGSPRAVHL